MMEVLIPTYDLVTFVGQYFKKLPQIKSFYHFRFHKDYPGTVFCKMYSYSEEKAIKLLRRALEASELIHTVPLSGIS